METAAASPLSTPSMIYCHLIPHSDIPFGIDTVSECFLPLAKDDLQNCEQLSRHVRQVQAGLIRASHVAVGGSGDLDLAEDDEATVMAKRVLKIIREEDDPVVLKQRRRIWAPRGRFALTSRIAQCRVPAGVRVTVLYAQNAHVQGQVDAKCTCLMYRCKDRLHRHLYYMTPLTICTSYYISTGIGNVVRVWYEKYGI
jgi:hypothetical protein